MTFNQRIGNITNKPRESKVQFSLTWKIALIFSFAFAVIYIITLMIISAQVTNRADDQIKVDLTQVLEGTAAGVDVEMLMELAADGERNGSGFSDDPRYHTLMDWLDTIHAAEPDAWPYLYIPAENEGYIYFVVDLYARYDQNTSSTFMELYKSNSGYILIGLEEQTYRAVDAPLVSWINNLAISIEGKSGGEESWTARTLNQIADWLRNSKLTPKKEFGTYEDKYGRWASGYMPLTDSSGEKVAGIGVDFRADLINQMRTEIRKSVQDSFLISYLFMLPLVVAISIKLTRPIVQLTETATLIGNNQHELTFPAPTMKLAMDEIDVLEYVLYDTYQKLRDANQQLHGLSRQLIIDREKYRKDLARDLHDNVLSYLSVISTNQHIKHNPASMEESYKQVVERLRATIFSLRSPMMEYGLFMAIEDYIDSVDSRLGVGHCEIEIGIPRSKVRFDPTTETHIFRIVQQALENALEHSKAVKIKISGEISADCINIAIEDNGCGMIDQLSKEINIEQYNKSGKFGVVGMNERAALIGADLVIEAGKYGGTMVRLQWQPERQSS